MLLEVVAFLGVASFDFGLLAFVANLVDFAGDGISNLDDFATGAAKEDTEDEQLEVEEDDEEDVEEDADDESDSDPLSSGALSSGSWLS